MFNKQTKNQEKELAAKINQDLVVRNMPKPTNFGVAPRPTSPIISGGQAIIKPKSNVKMVGFIIILAGLIFVGALIYLSYAFIIKPSAKTDLKTTQTNSSGKNSDQDILANNNENTVITVATTSITATTTPDILELATSTENINSEEADQSSNMELPPLVDFDGDGLLDDEESVLGTEINLTDSDNDGYTDLAEINNGYNPLGSGLLDFNQNINKYINSVIGYELLYPKNWEIQSLDDNQTIIFAAPDGSLIQVSTQENSNQQSILGWYENSFSSVTVTYDKLRSSDFWEGIMGEDNLNFYLTDQGRQNIYVISYIPVIEGRIAYPNIFDIIIDSLEIK